MTNIILQAKNVTKTVSEQNTSSSLTILNDINFHVSAAESVAIVGTSGAGKSTLLGLLAGLDTPTSGEIYIDKHCITDMDEEQRAAVRAKTVGFVFQSFQLLSSLTAFENVCLPMELNANKQAKELAQEYLNKVGLGHRLQHYPNQLSGGEQQRVAIARTFAAQPKLLFADEPTGNLDQKTGKTISDLLFDLNQQSQTTLIIVTHETRLAERCDRIIQIEDGQLINSSNS